MLMRVRYPLHFLQKGMYERGTLFSCRATLPTVILTLLWIAQRGYLYSTSISVCSFSETDSTLIPFDVALT